MDKHKEQLIEAYFSESLTPDQQKKFEQLLQHDRAFSEAFAFEKEVRDTVVYHERKVLRDRFRTLDNQPTKSLRKRTVWWFAAASILILLGAVWLVWERPQQATTEEL